LSSSCAHDYGGKKVLKTVDILFHCIYFLKIEKQKKKFENYLCKGILYHKEKIFKIISDKLELVVSYTKVR
jgi:hypothetical protein